MTASLKKLLIIAAFLTVGISATAQSSAIKTGPAGIPFGFISACYEKVINDYSSFQISLSPYQKVNDYDGSVYGANLEYRLYITKKEVLRGFYLTPKIGATNGNLTEIETGIDFDATSIHVMVNLGYQWIWNNGVLLDIGFGPRYSIGQGNNTASEFDGVSPDVIMAIGYVF